MEARGQEPDSNSSGSSVFLVLHRVYGVRLYSSHCLNANGGVLLIWSDFPLTFPVSEMGAFMIWPHATNSTSSLSDLNGVSLCCCNCFHIMLTLALLYAVYSKCMLTKS